jgi:hypothetical protein
MAPFIRRESSRMELGPICEAAKPLGHSWPFSMHWWLSLTAADQGAWISGLGAIAAVFATVVLAATAQYTARKSKRLSDETLARIIAMQIQRPIVAIIASLGVAVGFLDRLDEGRVFGKPEVLLRIGGQDALNDLVQRASDLTGMPLGAIESLVTLDMAVSNYNAMVSSLSSVFDEADGDPDAGRSMTVMLRPALGVVQAAASDVVNLFGAQNEKIARLGAIVGQYAPRG